jgi:enhancer of polycomb-like protein
MECQDIATELTVALHVTNHLLQEYHLQTILKDAGTSNDQEIPVPPPQESEIDYDQLYASRFAQPSSYIRFSQTVEECITCQYDMTIEDDEFLKEYNNKKAANAQLSEDDFEMIMEVFEDTASDQTPFASVDNTVVGYEMMVPSLNQLGSARFMTHAKPIYEYWKSRRQETGNKSLHPTLKFETHQESDEADPYVCFRRREARQTRKTRARDVQTAEKVKRLRRELEDGRQLVLWSNEREVLKREILHLDRMIFEQRAKLKEFKLRLGIKGEDEDLFNQKPQRRKVAELITGPRPPGGPNRQPIRSDGRGAEADLLLLADKLAEKENELRHDVEVKVQNHRKWNQHHIDLTRDPLSPVKDQGMELSFRPAKTQYLMTPPASTSSESMEVDEESNDAPVAWEKQNLPVFQFKAGGGTEPPANQQAAFRRRIGRLNRLWIDRRGLTTPPRHEGDEYSDRWKYDQDDDDEPAVYEVDPFDTRALKFRATIPLSPYMFPRRQGPAEALVNGHPATVAVNRPALPQPPPPQPQAAS